MDTVSYTHLDVYKRQLYNYYDYVFGSNIVYSFMLFLPCLIGSVGAVLFFAERDNDTFKNCLLYTSTGAGGRGKTRVIGQTPAGSGVFRATVLFFITSHKPKFFNKQEGFSVSAIVLILLAIVIFVVAYNTYLSLIHI